jgi:hypothetical protein
MPQDELSGPDLAGVVADATAAGLPHVVIGGFAVVFHGYVRATKDCDLLVPDGPEADGALLRFCERAEARRIADDQPISSEDIAGAENLRFKSRHGLVDILRGGPPPLDYETVAGRADQIEWTGQTVWVASLPSLVGFKRLARRPQDRIDLAELEAIHGELPIEPIPGLDQ